MCVCSLSYPACNAHAPYCHLWPVWIYCIFPHYLTNGTTFWKKVIEHKIPVLIFPPTFVLNISHSKKKKKKHWRGGGGGDYKHSYWMKLAVSHVPISPLLMPRNVFVSLPPP